MDVAIAAAVAKRLIKSKRETYVEAESGGPKVFYTAAPEAASDTGSWAGGALGMLLSFGISVWAAYLSWSCNHDVSPLLRAFFAACAFWFGAVYLVVYALFRAGTCGGGAQS